MKTLFLLSGLPGTGKSTTTKILSAINKDCVVVSSDNYIEEEAKRQNKTYNEVFASIIRTASKKSDQDFAYAVKNNMNIIVDKTLLTKKSRKKFIDSVPGYKIICVYFQVNDWNKYTKIIEARNRETGKNIPEHVISHFLKTIELPSTEEGIDEVTIMNALWEK